MMDGGIFNNLKERIFNILTVYKKAKSHMKITFVFFLSPARIQSFMSCLGNLSREEADWIRGQSAPGALV